MVMLLKDTYNRQDFGPSDVKKGIRNEVKNDNSNNDNNNIKNETLPQAINGKSDVGTSK